MGKIVKTVVTVAVTAVFTFTLTVWGMLHFRAGVADGGINKLDRVKSLIESRYLYDYNDEAMTDKAAEAYVAGLDEPYSYYFSAEDFDSYTSNFTGGYVGIGVTVFVNDDNMIEILAPFEDTPAYNAGIKPGDILKAVNGREYTGEEMNSAIRAIKGGIVGTTVDLIIVRDGEELSITVERGDIVMESVKTELMDGNIGYVRITGFDQAAGSLEQGTARQFDEKVKKLIDDGADRLIIDLRDNPGGVLTEVCPIADELLPEGVITYTEDKNGKRVDYNSDAECLGLPMAVLINGNSASASEVLTGALKDYGAATIIGTKSFGKGIVQEVYSFTDGSGVSLTVASYYTPNGVCIHDIGIEPDITVEMKDEYKDSYASAVPAEDDTQLQKAIEVVKEK